MSLTLQSAKQARGFTLLELLVAMFIAAIIFAMGYGAVNQAARSREELKEQQGRLLELENGVRILEQDFMQLAQRPVRQPVGDTYDPTLLANASSSSSTSSTLSPSSFSSSSSTSGTSRSLGANSSTSQALVALTRHGWTNPSGLQRPALQRVAYYFEKNTLRREYWPVLDPAQASTTVKRDLITHLKSVSLRYLDLGTAAQTGQSQSLSQNQGSPLANGNWSPIWPPVNNANQNNLRYRPIAVEITLETEDFGKIIRLVEIPG